MPAPSVRPLALAAAALVAVAAGAGVHRLRAEPGFHGTSFDQVAPAPDFALLDHRGAAATRASFQGSPTLLFFGYTRCPDICPRTLARLTRAVREGGRATKGVRIALVTVDPAHDTPAALAEYVIRFGPQVTGLTGDSAAVAAAMAGYGAYTMPPGGHTAHGARGAREAMLGHSAVVYGLDGEGNLRVVISEGASDRQIADDVRALARL